MKRLQIAGLCLLVAAMAALLTGARLAEAVTCNPLELNPCLGAITSSAPPSAACCQKLKEQQPCLCEYMKDPRFKPYVQSPGAKRVASICGVAVPSC